MRQFFIAMFGSIVGFFVALVLLFVFLVMVVGAVAGSVSSGNDKSITKDAMTFSHGPIPTIKWGAMTMEFKLPPGGAPGTLKPDDRASFEFFIDADDLPQLTRVTPMATAPAASAAADPKAATPGSKP